MKSQSTPASTVAKVVLAIGISTLICTAAAASTASFKIDFGAGSGQDCRSFLGCSPASSAPYSERFSIDTAPLASGGTVNILPSLSFADVLQYESYPPGYAHVSYSATADVVGGQIVGVNVVYSVSAPFVPAVSFHASGGTWRRNSNLQVVSVSSSESLIGTYTVAAVPEPAPWVLMALGGLLLRLARIFPELTSRSLVPRRRQALAG